MNKEDILKNLPQGFSEWKPEKYFKDEESIKVFTEDSKERRGDDAAYMAKLFEIAARARALNAKRQTRETNKGGENKANI